MKAHLSVASLVLILLAGYFLQSPTSSRPATALQASPAARDETFEVFGLVESPRHLAMTDLTALSIESVEASFELDGAQQIHRYTGVRLWDVLALAKPVIDPDRNGDPLRKFVVLTANDGYEVVISLGEIDPEFGGQPFLLAWEEDGAALPGDKGPVELVTPGDRTSGRYIWGIDTIEVRDVDSPPRG
jgi:DMSO/TMAO reductase YedYZ molybdopterin-dependent catalytic subunit